MGPRHIPPLRKGLGSEEEPSNSVGESLESVRILMAIGKFWLQWQCDASTSSCPLLTKEGILFADLSSSNNPHDFLKSPFSKVGTFR